MAKVVEMRWGCGFHSLGSGNEVYCSGWSKSRDIRSREQDRTGQDRLRYDTIRYEEKRREK
jgi:hypothetical protein